METSGEFADPDLLADAKHEDPNDNHFTELWHELYSKLNKLCYETAENTGLEPDIEDLKNSNKFLTKSIAKVWDSVSLIHNELKRDLGNLNNKFIELQRKFVDSENKILNSIESLRLQIIDNNDRPQEQQVDDEIQTHMPEFPNDADLDPWTKVTDRPDTGSYTQNLMSMATHVIPATMNRVPKFKKVVKGKAPEIGQTIAFSLKANIDPIDPVYTSATLGLQPNLDGLNLLVSKLSDVMAKQMGQLSEKIDHMSATPSQGEGPSNEVDEAIVFEEPVPPNPEKEAPRQCPVFASWAPSEASGEYKQCIECDAEFLINNWDFSEMLAEETRHLKEIWCNLHQEMMSRAPWAQRAPRGSGSYESF